MIKNKSAQITIFVIIGLIIVVAIVFAVMLVRDKSIFQPTKDIDPHAYISTCVSDSLAKAEKELLDSNGYPNKTDNYILYYGTKVPYLCKSSQFYKPCINQDPIWIEHFRSEIAKRISNDSEKCFTQLEEILRKGGLEVKEGTNKSFEIRFDKENIFIDMDRRITTIKNGESQEYNKFSASIKSPLYRLVDTARNIVNYESALCEFDAVKWMSYYRDISIKKFVTSDQTKIYTLIDKDSKKKMDIAIKTCDLPAGI